jgi:hypothetical protein
VCKLVNTYRRVAKAYSYTTTVSCEYYRYRLVKLISAGRSVT